MSDETTRQVNQDILGDNLKNELRAHHLMDLPAGRLQEKTYTDALV